MSYLPTKGILCGDNTLSFNKLQAPCHLGHTAGSPFRGVVSGGPKRMLILKRKLKEGSVPGLFGIIAKSMNSPAVSGQEFRMHFDSTGPFWGKRWAVALGDSNGPRWRLLSFSNQALLGACLHHGGGSMFFSGHGPLGTV